MWAKTFINRLADKLKYEGDVSPEEASEIAEFIDKKGKELNPKSSHYNVSFADSILRWLSAVEHKLPTNGNYVRTLPFHHFLEFSWRKDIKEKLRKCRLKLSFLDGIKEIERLGFEYEGDSESNRNFELFDYAGEIRKFPKLCQKISEMTDIFGSKAYASVKSVVYTESLLGCNKQSLLQTSILKFAASLKCEFIYARHYNLNIHDRVLMRPSDIDKISFMLKHAPDDVVRLALAKGYIDEQTAQKLFSGEWVKTGKIDITGICEEFIDYCLGRRIYEEAPEDDSWIDITR
jgi:hypothetical protein